MLFSDSLSLRGNCLFFVRSLSKVGEWHGPVVLSVDHRHCNHSDVSICKTLISLRSPPPCYYYSSSRSLYSSPSSNVGHHVEDFKGLLAEEGRKERKQRRGEQKEGRKQARVSTFRVCHFASDGGSRCTLTD